MTTCLEKNCKRPIQSRGLCSKHHQYYSRKVREGQITWAFLELCKISIPPKSKRKIGILK